MSIIYTICRLEPVLANIKAKSSIFYRATGKY